MTEVFPTADARGLTLVWLQQTSIRWSKEDDNEKNREWIYGLVETFQDSLAGNL
jgi:hypothetical protein